MHVVAIHQPNFLPYAGFFQKMILCDVFVLYDTAQFSRREYHSRNRIKTPHGVRWLSVPIRNTGISAIKEVETDEDQPWRDRFRKTLQVSYARTPHYREFAPEIQHVLESSKTGRLGDLNVALIRFLMHSLGIETPLLLASTLGAIRSMDPSGRLVELTQAAGGDCYLSGSGALEYLDPSKFTNVALHVVRFTARPYPQPWGRFVPNLSALDALFNCGRDAAQLLFDGDEKGGASDRAVVTEMA